MEKNGEMHIGRREAKVQERKGEGAWEPPPPDYIGFKVVIFKQIVMVWLGSALCAVVQPPRGVGRGHVEERKALGRG